LFSDEWITLDLKLHLASGELVGQVGYTVTNAWTDEVLATGVRTTAFDRDLSDLNKNVAELMRLFSAGYGRSHEDDPIEAR
jgi:hypothetical protein